MYLLACVLGFSLERALEAESPLARRLADNNEPCKESCDEGHDRECDQQDDRGQWTLSCDLHPTTSCDADCHFPPPPPMAPWLGASGTYPSPPPPPPPPDRELLTAAWIYFVVALVIFVFFIACCSFRASRNHPDDDDTRNYIAYWCCCMLPCFRTRRSANESWRNPEPRARASSGVSLPPVMIPPK